MASNMVYLGFAEHPEDFQTSAVQSYFFFLRIAAWLPGSYHFVEAWLCR